MYQRPVNALAEFVANAWDADAEVVELILPSALTEDAVIVVRDNGSGMSFADCQDRYLNVGWNRRGKDPDAKSPKNNRPILGRKGIGKFAGFGIAELIRVDTTSEKTGERTVFELDLNELLGEGEEYVSTEELPISVFDYSPEDEKRKQEHGTVVTLSRLRLKKALSPGLYAKSMSRRFLLHQQQENFRVSINGQPLPNSLDLEGVEYVFPKDYEEHERPSTLEQIEEGGWGTETVEGCGKIRWRIVFHKETIDEEELQGITVFAKGKLVQKPFLFDLIGGLSGQHGVTYLSGQVEANFLDSLKEDVTSTERERIDWGREESRPLLEWGQQRVKKLLRIWHDRRGEKRAKELEEKVAMFSERLEKLPPHERKTVKGALRKLGQVSTLSDAQFNEVGEAVLTAWEQGRVRELIASVSESAEMSEGDLLKILLEAQVVTALNTAEAVKTKLLTVGGLKVRIRKQELEAAVRDFIAKNPWLISPKWETYRIEKRADGIIEDEARKAKLTGPDWEGRVDLVLSSGDHLLILEFMRPGLKVDWDHLTRFERYIRLIRARVKANTGGPFRVVTGYIIADKLEKNADNLDKIEHMPDEDMFAMDWEMLFGVALAQWQEFLQILAERAPGDERLQALMDVHKKA